MEDTNIATGLSEAKRETDMTRVLSDQDKYLQLLGDSLDRLALRLQPVLRTTDMPRNEKELADKNPLVPLAQRVDANNSKISTLTDSLSVLIEGLEV